MSFGKADDDEDQDQWQSVVSIGDTAGQVTITMPNNIYDQNYSFGSVWSEENVVTDYDIKIEELTTELREFKESMEERMAAVEDQIVLVRRDNALEEDFEELREAWEKYNEILDKLRTFKAIQDSA